MKQCWKIKIYGKVQGVWYRASTQRQAKTLGLVGYVKNEGDGSVYAIAQGEEELLKKLVEWCKEGPPFAQVSKVIVEEAGIHNFEDFEVRR